MIYYTFYRESNKFDDILSDPNIKSNVSTKIKWNKYLLLGLKYSTEDYISGYIVLKYGDDIVKLTNRDFTPIPNVDYVPKKS